MGVHVGGNGIGNEFEGFDAVVYCGDCEAEFLDEADCNLLVDFIYIQSVLHSVA